jgi:GcrA cell cycle regulator
MDHMSEWSDKEIAMLKQLYKSGERLSYIIKKLKRKKNSVIGKLHRLGLYKGPRRKVELKPTPPKIKPQPQLVVVAPLVGSKYDPPIHIAREDGISFFDLEPHHCRWPFGDRDYWFCGKPHMENSSYCEYHYKRARTGP